MTTGYPREGAVNARRAAEFLGSTEGTLAKWRHQRVGPPFLKMNGKVLYRLSSLDAYLDKLEQEQMARR